MNKAEDQIYSIKTYTRIRYLPFVACAIVLMSAMLAWSLERAPLNPEFQQYQEQLRAKTVATRTADGHGLGHMPAPTKLPPPVVSLPRGKFQAPSSYDLRNYNKVSPVQDQGNYGNCWTFATFGSMESCLLPGESWDFSENNLANLHGLDSPYGEGGQSYMSLAYLGRWSGPVLESADPYSNGPNGSPTGLPVQKHVQSAWFIPDRTSSTDNETIKSIIMNYGGFYSAFYYNNAYYNSANCAYYYSGSSAGNHAITIVGWDDTFSRTKFNTAPSGDGAFLIKNSWGTSWGNAGYFWISYYDARIGKDNCLFQNAESTSNYESIYQYDMLGYCTSFGYGSTTAYGANIFSGSSGSIKAVSFYAMAAGASYEVKVYTGVTAGSPTSGTLSATKSGTVTYAGYYTVVLDSPVSYSTRFSVVVKFTTPGYTYPIPCEYRFADYSSAATAAAGESYLSSDGSSWEEAKDGSLYFNVCIKAFGAGGGEGPTPPPPTPSSRLRAQGLNNDFDGDNKADFSLYNYLSGNWYIYSSLYNTWMAYGVNFGAYSYFPVPGDYDGNRKADVVDYSRSTAWWLIYYTGLGSANYFQWGSYYCIPAPGDYDGDGKSDFALYNFVTGQWYIFKSSTYTWLIYGGSFGAYGYLPVPGDYNGGGESDLVIYSENDGLWCFYYTETGISGYLEGFGGPGYVPAPGDFDGDDVTDFGLYDYWNGYWYVWSPVNGWIAYGFKWANYNGYYYTPVAGDYDGDNISDIAVYSRYYSDWYIYCVGTGYSTHVSFGGIYYIPVVYWGLYWYM